MLGKTARKGSELVFPSSRFRITSGLFRSTTTSFGGSSCITSGLFGSTRASSGSVVAPMQSEKAGITSNPTTSSFGGSSCITSGLFGSTRASSGSPAPRLREKAGIFQTPSTTSFGGSNSGSGIASGLFGSTRAPFSSGSGARSSDENDVSITKADLISWAKRLYYEGKPEYALEILEWMDRKEMKFSPSELQLYVGTLCKVRGFESGRAYFEKVEPDFDENNATAKNAPAFMTLMTWKDDWPPMPKDLDFICDRKKMGDLLWGRTNK